MSAPSSDPLRLRLIRIAHANPEIRPLLLPLLLERVAKEFPSQQALEDYLDDHPNAAKEKHWVAGEDGADGEKKDEGESKDKKPKDEEAPSKDEGEAKKEPSNSAVSGTLKNFLSKVKGASKSIVDSVQQAPKEVQRLVSDPEARKTALSNAAEAVKKAPKEMVKRIYDAAKKEAHEIKHAGHAVGKIIKGEKLDKSDKKAIYSVGVYVAGAALAATGGGALIAAGAIGKSFVAHVAIKAVHGLLDDGFLHFEAAESVAHGIGHVMHVMEHVASDERARLIRAAEEGDEEVLQAALVAQITAYVAKVLKDGVPDEDMESIMKGADEDPDINGLPDEPKVKSMKGTPGKEASLRERLIRLAHARPEMRPHILPLLPREAALRLTPAQTALLQALSNVASRRGPAKEIPTYKGQGIVEKEFCVTCPMRTLLSLRDTGAIEIVPNTAWVQRGSETYVKLTPEGMRHLQGA